MRCLRPAILLLALAGCATSPGACDPARIGNVIQAAGCTWGGGYTARQAELAREVETKLAAYQLSQGETARLAAEARQLAGDREAWQARLAGMSRNLARLQLDVSTARASSERGRARLDALRREAVSLQARLDRSSAQGSATEAQIQELTLEIERKERAIRELLGADEAD